MVKPSLLLMRSWEGEEKLLIEAAEESENAEWPGQEAISTKMRTVRPRLPVALVAAPTSMLEQRGHIIVRRTRESSLMPCSCQAEPSIPLISVSPTSPNVELMPSEVSHDKLSHSRSLMRAWEDEHEQEMFVKTNGSPTCLNECPAYENGFLEPSQPNAMDRQPDQMAVSEIVNSAHWHSQESAAAHMPPTNEPVS
jgi:hypothetical protein